MTGIAAALDDPLLLAPQFAGASWARWRAILRAAEGLPLDETATALFREVADRDPPAGRVRELWVVGGRRSGKDSIASAIATVAALGDYPEYLRPGERAVVMCLACDRDQARIVHRYIAGYFQENKLLAPLVAREDAETIELHNRVDIVIATNSYRAVRGRTIVCAIFDEVAFWRSDDSANPDLEIYNAIEPGLVTIPGAMIIGISSPYRRGSGLLYRKFLDAYGKPDRDILVVRGPSTAFNPLLPQRIIDAAIERDPDAAAAEWLAEWRSDLSDAFDRAAIEACVARGVREIAPAAGVTYAAFVDPAGGSGGDSAALAIAHIDRDGGLILDCLRERRPPFSPDDTIAEFAAVLRAYGVSRVRGDRWAGAWPVESFGRLGITYEQSAAPKSDQYRELLPLLNSRRAQLLDHPRLISQLCALERRVTRAGRDSIAEPSGARDDLANAAAGALTGLAADARPALIRKADMVADSATEPPVCTLIYCTLWVTAFGEAAAVYAAPAALHGEEITIVDIVHERAMSAAVLDAVAARLGDLVADARARWGGRAVSAWMFVPEIWEPRAAAALDPIFWPQYAPLIERTGSALYGAAAIPKVWLADPVRLLYAANLHTTAGKVKFTAAALQRAESLPLFGALGWQPGRERVDDDALRMAALLTVALAFSAEHDDPVIEARR